jgi:hypothetical protein
MSEKEVLQGRAAQATQLQGNDANQALAQSIDGFNHTVGAIAGVGPDDCVS